jgi:parallel beta-helix repeat protein
LIQGNLIRGNVAYNNGGGISIRPYYSPIVADNVITNNSSLSGGHGGGIYISSSDLSQPFVIVNNTISGNSAFDGTSAIYSIGYVQRVTISITSSLPRRDKTPGSSLATSIMTITTSQGNTLVGTYSISVQGTSGSLSRLGNTQLIVTKK